MDDNGPLSGLRVLDLSTMISGGFATAMLADFGADVVSVEHPDRPDPIRDWNPSADGVSLWWKSLARNKRCITLDLSADGGHDLALELAEDADVLVENFRPGTMERWGLDYGTLSAANEGLVMVRLSGYGQTGPRSGDPGFGSVAEGISGFAHVNGFPDSPPLLPPIPLADLTAAQFAVQGAMFAVYEREVGGSGRGQVVDVSLYEPLFRLFASDVEAYGKLGRVRGRTGNRSTSSAPRNVYETADGYIALSASAQRIFENVMAAIGREDLVDDPRFETNAKRVENADALDEYIEGWTRERPRDEVVETMTENDAIAGPIYDVEDVFGSDLYEARGDIVAVDDPEVGRLETPAPVPRFSRTPGRVDHAGPRHGEHNDEVYRGEVGLDPDRYERLRGEGVI